MYCSGCKRTRASLARSKKPAEHTHPDPVSRNRGRLLRTPPTQPVGSAAGAAPAAHAAAAPASVRGNICGLRTRTRRGGDDGEARRVETRWRGAARGDNRAIVASPGSARMPTLHTPDPRAGFRSLRRSVRCQSDVRYVAGHTRTHHAVRSLAPRKSHVRHSRSVHGPCKCEVRFKTVAQSASRSASRACR